MKGSVILAMAATALLPLLLNSCGSSGGGSVSENRSNRGFNPGVGPFDSRGNYVEKWADDKSKGRWWRSSSVRESAVAKTETKKPTTPAVAPPVIASNVTPSPAAASRPTYQPRPPVGTSRPTPTPRPRPAVVSKPKPKPKPVARTKPKSKPPIRHVIKKGDTLYGLSRKYGTSVTAIQRANGLKGTNLRIGKSLLIPRY
ncbi:LysM peptidoglycan-binding domain-containing protein [Verrucomicrobiaceae bacterium R5-34]|uniref:LysM peptidoglycan-binding domain-containing protein n=1 Tax=Oceaniferula flava TaxID=2800421 RepID=A0AAE2SD71_9BACT|nr:LysM peptidoglycan-binding domain-containing protein [Oceaniferula flavus]MBK1831178.1 LysM peptidoglycan-binding domain-containing protein [Verrucomicrobiaceae bacterium R5-34]MBK1855694.1 LysM peptidoglycan-binding domain-containing protein [Oceaniferula flavus]MBM1137000.1 LysM peptidoglycan-binding domain-containing protein [Oceaniferula flavus]